MARKDKPGQSPLSLKDIPKGDLKYFLSYFKPHWHLFAADLFFAVLVAAIDVCFPAASRYLLNILLPQFKDSPDYVFRTFFIIIGLFFLLYLLRTLAYWFITYFGHVFGVAVEKTCAGIFLLILKNSLTVFLTKTVPEK